MDAQRIRRKASTTKSRSTQVILALALLCSPLGANTALAEPPGPEMSSSSEGEVPPDPLRTTDEESSSTDDSPQPLEASPENSESESSAEQSYKYEIRRVADAPTLQSYRSSFLQGPQASRDAGFVWTDKSVFARDSASQSRAHIDGESVSFSDDFLEVFSALGSSQLLNGSQIAPIDLVLVLDISTSMGKPVDETERSEAKKTHRIDSAVAAANESIEYLMRLHEDNRVAVVLYGGTSDNLLAPLAHYQQFDPDGSGPEEPLPYLRVGAIGSDYTFTVSLTAQNEQGEKQTKSISNRKGASADTYIVGDTNLQSGIYRGMKLLADQPETTWQNSRGKMVGRIPALFAMSDGGTKSIMNGTWQKPEPGTIEVHNVQDQQSSPAIILHTLMSAAYMKAAVEKNYQNTRSGLTVYTIGMELTDQAPWEPPRVHATLNPSEYFTPDGGGGEEAPYIAPAYSAWQEWKSGNEPSLKTRYDNTAAGNPSQSRWKTLTFHQLSEAGSDNPYAITKEEVEKNITYADRYFNTTSADMPDLFTSLVKTMTGTVFHPVCPSSENPDTATISFADPLGPGMEVKSVKELRLFGRVFSVEQTSQSDTSQSGTTVYRIIPDRKGSLKNPAYEDGPVISLDSFKISVQAELDPRTGAPAQTLRFTFPETALPLHVNQVDLSLEQDEFGQRTASSCSVDRSVAPLRLIYTVGCAQDLPASEGTFDKDSLPEFLRQAMNPDGGTLRLYASSGSAGSKCGAPSCSFVASESNRFYLFQSHGEVFETADGFLPGRRELVSTGGTVSLQNPVTDLSSMDPRKTYYLADGFYENSSGQSARYVQWAMPRKGSDLIDDLIYSDSLGAVSPSPDLDGSRVVTTRIGGLRMAHLRDYAVQKPDGNITGTASEASWQQPLKQSDGSYVITSQFGNNGLVDIELTLLDPDPNQPENPEPQKPDPQTPDPESPEPQTPDPENPDPDNPNPGTPDTDNPKPGTPDPNTPDPEDPGTGVPGPGNSETSPQNPGEQKPPNVPDQGASDNLSGSSQPAGETSSSDTPLTPSRSKVLIPQTGDPLGDAGAIAVAMSLVSLITMVVSRGVFRRTKRAPVGTMVSKPRP